MRIMNVAMESKLQDFVFFRGMEAAHLRLVADCCSEVVFEEGQIIFLAGEPANQFYLIQSGLVAVESRRPDGRTAQIETVPEGEVLGWSWLFPPFAWHFQARALAPTRAIKINGARLLVAAEANPQFGYRLMKQVARVAIHRLDAARQRLGTL